MNPKREDEYADVDWCDPDELGEEAHELWLPVKEML